MREKSDEYPELIDWPWYVDDSVLKCKNRKADPILEHLNSIEPESFMFTKEVEQNNKLAVLDLGLNVNRETKKVEFNVHYKKTNTNITIKKKSNHRESTKRGVIKGYADRARSYCDPGYLEDELNNIIDIFEDNGYTRKEVKDAMESKERNPMENEQEKISRGIVIMQNAPGFTQEFNRIARQHGFTVTNKTENRVKDLIANAKTPLGIRTPTSSTVFHVDVGNMDTPVETDQMWDTRRKTQAQSHTKKERS